MISVGIIGTGSIARSHVEACRVHASRCRIIAVYDIDKEKATRFVKEKELEGAVVCGSLEEFLGTQPDLAAICTPPSAHAEGSVRCLDAGIAVLCEKPMAPSPEECDRILDAARRSGRLLSIVAQNRFRAPYWKLKKVLESGLTGAINYLQVSSAWWRGLNYYDLWWRGTWSSEGGGCTLNHAVHHIDMALWFAGRPQKVKAFLANTSHGNSEVEDLSAAILAYPSGALGQITSSVVHHGEQQEILIQTEKALIRHPWQVAAETQRENGFGMPNPKAVEELEKFAASVTVPAHENHAGQYDDVLTALETGGPVLIDGESGRNTVELITAIYSAAFFDRTEILPLAPDHEFRTRAGILGGVRKFHEKTGSVKDFNEDITVGGSNAQF